jgi:hypothetical protein
MQGYGYQPDRPPIFDNPNRPDQPQPPIGYTPLTQFFLGRNFQMSYPGMETTPYTNALSLNPGLGRNFDYPIPQPPTEPRVGHDPRQPNRPDPVRSSLVSMFGGR